MLGIRLGAAVLAAAALACARGDAAARPAAVVATIEPLAMLARALAPPGLEVAALVPAGASPHHFEPRPSDVARMARAALWIRVGGDFDAWSARLAKAAEREPETLALLSLPGIDPLPADASHADAYAGSASGDPESHHTRAPADPHLWLDPLRMAEVAAPAIAEALARIAPGDRLAIDLALAELQSELRALDAELRARFASGAATRRGFVTLHASWRYFAARYGLRELGAVIGVAAEEPTPRALAELVRRARAQGGAELLLEPQLPAAIAETLAAELAGRTRPVDPLGDPADPERASYLALLRWNARAFDAATASGEGA
jgi:zinc transport system substrate-binding protein